MRQTRYSSEPRRKKGAGVVTWGIVIGLAVALLIIGVMIDLKARRRGQRLDIDAATVDEARRRAQDRRDQATRKSTGFGL